MKQNIRFCFLLYSLNGLFISRSPPLSPSRMCACVTRDAALPRDRVNNTKNNCEIGNCNLGSILHWPFFLSVLPCSEGTLESLKCGDFVLIEMYEVESFSIYLLNSENLNKRLLMRRKGVTSHQVRYFMVITISFIINKA